jgi:hypothetical protein
MEQKMMTKRRSIYSPNLATITTLIMETSRSVATSSMPGRDDHGGLVASRRRVGMADDWWGFEIALNEGVVAFSDGAPPRGDLPPV